LADLEHHCVPSITVAALNALRAIPDRSDKVKQ
jgi:hypothetical protein